MPSHPSKWANTVMPTINNISALTRFMMWIPNEMFRYPRSFLDATRLVARSMSFAYLVFG